MAIDYNYYGRQASRIENGNAKQYTSEEIEERKKEFASGNSAALFYILLIGLIPAFILITFLSRFVTAILIFLISDAPMLPEMNILEIASQILIILFSGVLSFIYTFNVLGFYGRKKKKPLTIIFSALGLIAFIIHVYVFLNLSSFLPSDPTNPALKDYFFIVFPINFYVALLCIIINPGGCNKCRMTNTINETSKTLSAKYSKVYDSEYHTVDHYEKRGKYKKYCFCVICERIKRTRIYSETSRTSFQEYALSEESKCINEREIHEYTVIKKLIDAINRVNKK